MTVAHVCALTELVVNSDWKCSKRMASNEVEDSYKLGLKPAIVEAKLNRQVVVLHVHETTT